MARPGIPAEMVYLAHMRKPLVALAALVLAGAGCATSAKITTFEECAAAGNPVMESYPRQCRAQGQTFVEQVPPPAPPEEQPEAATFSVGQTVAFDGGLSMTLTAIDDSRCPKDVVCIWAGELSARFQVALGGASQEIVLGQTTKPEASVDGRTVTLTAITETSATVRVSK